MSKKGDHHYVPQFHLKKWQAPSRKISQWARNPNNQLEHKFVTSAQTAYTPGLYSLAYVSPGEANQIENLFTKIENNTRPVLEKLIKFGPEKLCVRERYWWTLYLNASLLRVPHIVEKVKSSVDERLKYEFSQPMPEFELAKGNAPEATLLAWALKNAPARVENSGLIVLVKVIENETIIDRIIHLEWIVRDVSSADGRLLLGDNPCEIVGDLYKRRTLISIPLSPTHIFFASDALDMIEHLKNCDVNSLVVARNISTLTTAKKFAYGEADRDFIERYL